MYPFSKILFFTELKCMNCFPASIEGDCHHSTNRMWGLRSAMSWLQGRCQGPTVDISRQSKCISHQSPRYNRWKHCSFSILNIYFGKSLKLVWFMVLKSLSAKVGLWWKHREVHLPCLLCIAEEQGYETDFSDAAYTFEGKNTPACHTGSWTQTSLTRARKHDEPGNFCENVEKFDTPHRFMKVSNTFLPIKVRTYKQV